MNIHDAVEQYGHWRLGSGSTSVNTWRGERPGLEAFALCMTGLDRNHVHQIEPEHIDKWWAGTVLLAPSTRGTRLHQLRSFLLFCIRRGWLDKDPSRLLSAPRIQPVPRERLDADGLLSLLDVARTPRDRILLALGLNLAVRGSEIKRMTLADVDLDKGTLLVHVEKTTEFDYMPITSDLDAELRRWLLHYRTTCATLDKQSYLVPSQHINPTRNRVTYRPGQVCAQPYEVVKRALTDVGWENVKQEGVHTLRRSVARLYFGMAEEEGSFDSAVLATMTLLHHTRPETTLKYIGVDRHVQARVRVMRGRPFLTKLASAPVSPVRSIRDERTA